MSKLHPIMQDILRELRGEDGQLYLPKAGLHRIEAAVDALAGSPDLVWAVRSLLAFAAHLELDHDAPDPAHALMRIVATRTPTALARQLDGAQRRVEDRTRRVQTSFSRLAAVNVERRAPRHDVRAPVGAVGLGALVLGRRDFDPARALAERRARMGR